MMAQGALGAFRSCKERLPFPDCSHASGLAAIAMFRNSRLAFSSRDLPGSVLFVGPELRPSRLLSGSDFLSCCR